MMKPTIANLPSLTDEEIKSLRATLQAEIDRREAAADKVARAKQEKENAYAIENVEVLLRFMDHSFSNCSDAHPFQTTNCMRCILVDACRDGVLDYGYCVKVEVLETGL